MQPVNPKINNVRQIMMDFADLTGLSSKRTPRRYLWTDAFAVCNFLELYRLTGHEEYRKLALRLIEQVHEILGRHRDDDSRRGWISGLDEREGALHPTRGGLRIGKSMNERGPGDPLDEELEWDRDGQYYHYLTKWMHALNRAGRVTGDSNYIRWAVELARAVHARFTYGPKGRRRMYWKMSIDLSRPLVPSMGHHDPLDGLITCLELEAAREKDSERSPAAGLGAEIADMAQMCEGMDWATRDPLGAGELLNLGCRLAQLILETGMEETGLLNDILIASRPGLESFDRGGQWDHPADIRLAFRELGLSIGVHAVERLNALERFKTRTDILMRYAHLGGAIETFWLDPANQEADSWTAHRDINMVMLATSLAPDGYLLI